MTKKKFTTDNVSLIVNAIRKPSTYDPAVSFSLSQDPNHPTNYLQADGSLVFPMDPKQFDITFTLKSDPTLRMRFLSDPKKAIYISEGSKCPTGSGDGKGQFKGHSVVKGDVLTIKNLNGKKQDYKYVLRFYSVDLGRNVYFDPIIINGGGGVSPIDEKTKALVIIGGLLIGALALFGRRFLRR